MSETFETSEMLRKFIKASRSKFASIAEDGVVGGDVDTFYDTGSYILNALISGSIFGGVPSNRSTGFSAESATGKTFLILGIIKNYLEKFDNGLVCLFESEGAISKKMLIERGIDASRVAVFPCDTVEEFRDNSLRILECHLQTPKDVRPRLAFALDSLGMLSTTKEISEALASSGTKDMTRAQLIKSSFRVLTLKMSAANIPMLITNHVYANIGSTSPLPKSGGGGGFKYAVSTEITLSKSKYKPSDGMDPTGIIVLATAVKSRLTIENTKARLLIKYSGGLDKYYGLLPIAEAVGATEKVAGGRYVIGDKKYFEKNIIENPSLLYTDEVLRKIDEWTRENFTYGADKQNNVVLDISGEE